MAKISFNRNFSIGRVVAKLVSVTLALYVGNTIMNVLGSVMNGTTGPFNLGFKLIGWTVSDSGQITAYSGTGVLAVIGLVGIASIVMEFVEFRMG